VIIIPSNVSSSPPAGLLPGIYAGSWVGLFLPTSGGYTFRTTADGLGSDIVWNLTADETTLYAATNGGLSISTDGGATFNNRTTANSGLGDTDVRSVYVDGATIYACTYRSGLWKSTDGGASFTLVASQANGLLDTDITRDVYVVGSKIYLATHIGPYVSTNGGATFVRRQPDADAGVCWAVAYSGGRLYSAQQVNLWFSDNDGVSWTFRNTSHGLGNSYVWDVAAVGSTVYAATEGGLSISTNSGVSFANKTTANGLVSNETTAAAGDGTNVFAGGYGNAGVAQSINGGTSFTQPFSGFGANGVNKLYYRT